MSASFVTSSMSSMTCSSAIGLQHGTSLDDELTPARKASSDQRFHARNSEPVAHQAGEEPPRVLRRGRDERAGRIDPQLRDFAADTSAAGGEVGRYVIIAGRAPPRLPSGATLLIDRQ